MYLYVCTCTCMYILLYTDDILYMYPMYVTLCIIYYLFIYFFDSNSDFQKRKDLRSTAANCSKIGRHCVIDKL